MEIIQVNDLSKSYPLPWGRKAGRIEAVQQLQFTVEPGEIVGLLGPNGAGKSTTLRLLATLARPDSGSIRIDGFDTSHLAERVRERIGYVGQSGGMDGLASGRENLRLFARLYHLHPQAAAARIEELLNALGLAEMAQRPAITYSGGQRRRLDLAAGLIHQPRVLFLDEPTLGLDPVSRAQVWQEVRRARSGGVTVLLSTNYLDEAATLCDRVLVIDRGRLLAADTPENLTHQLGGDQIHLTLDRPEADLARAQEFLQNQPFIREVHGYAEMLAVAVEHGEEALAPVLNALNNQGIAVRELTLSRPSLDDVFLHLTGHGFHPPS